MNRYAITVIVLISAVILLVLFTADIHQPMIDLNTLRQQCDRPQLAAWLESLPDLINQRMAHQRHGDLADWQGVIRQLPPLIPDTIQLNRAAILIGSADQCDETTRQQLEQQLRQLHPWRKGPYSLFGVEIDTEWRSDLKWDRLADEIEPLDGRLVLDVGCGNGYHGWRMVGAGAGTVIGIDPTLLSIIQFGAIKQLAGPQWPLHLLPLGIEDMPPSLAAFDTVFSMGILYHRRSPIDHLLELHDLLRPGGELVLETLIVDGPAGMTLVPPNRYAKMRNVWFLPSPATLLGWLERCGFQHIRLIDCTVTTIEEQRSTEWMHFHSLANFLDPDDPLLTCEGLPAPQRAIFLAKRK